MPTPRTPLSRFALPSATPQWRAASWPWALAAVGAMALLGLIVPGVLGSVGVGGLLLWIALAAPLALFRSFVGESWFPWLVALWLGMQMIALIAHRHDPQSGTRVWLLLGWWSFAAWIAYGFAHSLSYARGFGDPIKVVITDPHELRAKIYAEYVWPGVLGLIGWSYVLWFWPREPLPLEALLPYAPELLRCPGCNAELQLREDRCAVCGANPAVYAAL